MKHAVLLYTNLFVIINWIVVYIVLKKHTDFDRTIFYDACPTIGSTSS